jgi:putative transposase
MCDLLGVARSSFYQWSKRVETPTRARRRQLAIEVRWVFDDSRETFGGRRVAAQLNRDGHECSVGLVADLMRELGLKAVQPRAYKRTTIPGEQPVESPDLIGRDFDPANSAPGERLVGDITYLQTGEGWLYLATVIDLATRMVIGWQLATHMRTSVVTDALAMGVDAGLVAPDAIFHSDRGSQYTSTEYWATLKKLQIRASMGRVGSCYDNAVAESYFASLKAEIGTRVWATRAEARRAVFAYITYYNRKRLHSTLKHRTPYEARVCYRPPIALAA